MNRPPIISILGNSVPILIQPFRTGPDDKTYAEHLRDDGFSVVSAAKQSAMLSDIYHYLEDECIRHFPDYVIINFGIVECTVRARPRWLQNVFAMNAWNNSVIRKGYNGPVTRGMKFVAKKWYRKSIERALYSAKLGRPWMSTNQFQFILRDVVKRIFQDTPAKKIVILGLPAVADWVEQEAPGTQANVDRFNRAMKDITAEHPSLVWINPKDIQAASDDGIHFTSTGHATVATAIKQHLHGERENYTDWQQINQYKGLYRLYENWNKRSIPRSK